MYRRAGWFGTVFRIRISKFLRLQDPYPLVTRYRSVGSFHRQAKILRKKPLDFYSFVTSGLFIFVEWCKCTFKSNEQKNYFLLAS